MFYRLKSMLKRKFEPNVLHISEIRLDYSCMDRKSDNFRDKFDTSL